MLGLLQSCHVTGLADWLWNDDKQEGIHPLGVKHSDQHGADLGAVARFPIAVLIFPRLLFDRSHVRGLGIMSEISSYICSFNNPHNGE